MSPLSGLARLARLFDGDLESFTIVLPYLACSMTSCGSMPALILVNRLKASSSGSVFIRSKSSSRSACFRFTWVDSVSVYWQGLLREVHSLHLGRPPSHWEQSRNQIACSLKEEVIKKKCIRSLNTFVFRDRHAAHAKDTRARFGCVGWISSRGEAAGRMTRNEEGWLVASLEERRFCVSSGSMIGRSRLVIMQYVAEESRAWMRGGLRAGHNMSGESV